MPQMQDKEFDQLFRDTFEDAQVEPSLNLWNSIEQNLEVKPKRVLPVYWAAAAVVISALTAGLLFMQPAQIKSQEELSVQTKPLLRMQGQEADIATTASQSASETTGTGTIAISGTAYENKPYHNTTAATEPRGRVARQVAAEEESAEQKNVGTSKKELLSMQPLAAIAHHDNKVTVILDQLTKNVAILQPVPAEEIMLANAGSMETEEEANEDSHTENKRIRNVGDLVNFVVDKVDKREEKFIQFKTDDDDNSSLVALNIGMFRFNNKKHK
jgi:hypothetical protein